MPPPLIKPSPLTFRWQLGIKKAGAPVGGAPQVGLVMELADITYSVYVAYQHEGSNPSQTIV